MVVRSLDSFSTRRELDVAGKKLTYFSLREFAQNSGLDVTRLPYALEILLENLLRCEDGNAVTKQDIVAAASTLPASITFVGGHPLGGAERGGFAFATPMLFSGRPWIFTPDGNPQETLERLSCLVVGLGARPVSTKCV